LLAADALRRPERLDALLDACACDALSRPGAGPDYPPAAVIRASLAIVKRVAAAAVARDVAGRSKKGAAADAIARAVRAARLQALREWKRSYTR
jgi:tRNA nucleotidyltransferase (CCA-adding enzyme)